MIINYMLTVLVDINAIERIFVMLGREILRFAVERVQYLKVVPLDVAFLALLHSDH